MINFFYITIIFFLCSCETKDPNRVELKTAEGSLNSKYDRSYLSFIPPYSPEKMPNFSGSTQFYGKIYHINELEVHFAIDISDSIIVFYADTNMDQSISNKEKFSLTNNFEIIITPFEGAYVTVKFNTNEFIRSKFLNPFVDFNIQNKRSAKLKLGNDFYKLTLLDLQNNGFKKIEQDKLMLENETQLKTLNINKNYESYLIRSNVHYEFKISENLDYIEIKENIKKGMEK